MVYTEPEEQESTEEGGLEDCIQYTRHPAVYQESQREDGI